MKGLAFHCHHDVLLEYVHDYDERVAYIKKYKPLSEQELRLKLFKMIPEDRLPQKGLATYDKARGAYYKVRAAYDKARGAYDKAWAAYDKANKEDIEALHKELCPACTWDGETIFKEV